MRHPLTLSPSPGYGSRARQASASLSPDGGEGTRCGDGEYSLSLAEGEGRGEGEPSPIYPVAQPLVIGGPALETSTIPNSVMITIMICIFIFSLIVVDNGSQN